jgi:hypothetical protein
MSAGSKPTSSLPGCLTGSGLTTSTSMPSLPLTRNSSVAWQPSSFSTKAPTSSCWDRPESARPRWPSALAIRALEEGHRIFFIACHDLVARFRKAVRYDRVDRLLATILRPRLLILDEIGYTPLDRAEATFLFEVVAKRYDRCKPMIVTSNKSWGAWGEILPDQVMTAAILDRLLHRSVTINIQGESYRLRAHRKAGLNPSPWIDQKGGPETPSDVSNQNR